MADVTMSPARIKINLFIKSSRYLKAPLSTKCDVSDGMWKQKR